MPTVGHAGAAAEDTASATVPVHWRFIYLTAFGLSLMAVRNVLPVRRTVRRLLSLARPYGIRMITCIRYGADKPRDRKAACASGQASGWRKVDGWATEPKLRS